MASLIIPAAHLGCPKDYLDGLRGRFDFSATKVRLVPSVNGSFSGAEGKEYGLLRLRELAVQHFKAHPGLIGAIEVCTASVGNLQTTQLVRNMTAALQGGPGGPAVNFKVVYPSEAQVDRMHKRSELVLPVEVRSPPCDETDALSRPARPAARRRSRTPVRPSRRSSTSTRARTPVTSCT